MIEVKIPKDVKDYQEKFFFSMTLRQTLCFALGVGIVVPSFLLGIFKYNMNADLLGWVALLVLIPIFFVGFISIKGLTLEKFFMASLKTVFIYPQKRYFRKDNEWSGINGK